MSAPQPPGLTTSVERHASQRINWLRAAVLGANDGLISTASLIAGVAGANPDRAAVLLAGVAALVAGAFSMAAGEYVSVSSQSDTEAADLARERLELANDPAAEQAELAAIWRARGLSPALADQVAAELMAGDALAAHARDELGLSETLAAQPLQAALASGITFATGAALPLAGVALAPPALLLPVLGIITVTGLVGLGWMGARAGGAPPLRAVLRVTLWGSLALAATWGIGRLAGTTLG